MNKLILLLFALLCGFSIWQSNLVLTTSNTVLQLFFEVLIPSLFFMMFLLKVMEQTGLLAYLAKWLRKPAYFLCKATPSELPYLLSGLCLGFAANAILVKEAYLQQKISQASAQRLLYTCHTPTISFCVLTCGTLLQDTNLGLLLFGIQLVAALLFYRFLNEDDMPLPIHKQKPLLSSLQDALKTTGFGLYQMAGYILIASVILSFITYFLPAELYLPLQSITDFASSAVAVCKLALPQAHKLLLLSVIFGFGGFCGHLQVYAMSDPIPLKYHRYFAWRIAQAFFCAGLCFIYIWLQA